MGGKNKGQSSGTQQQAQSPWGPQANALQYGFGEAQNIYQQGPAYAPFSPTSEGAIAQSQQVYPQVGQQLGATIGGDYLGEANPYLQDVAARANRDAMSGVNATFGGAGRTGGGLHQQSLATSMGDVSASIYAPAYEAERNRQLQATGMAPSLINQQMGTGSIVEDKEMERQLAPYTNLERYMALVGGGPYGSTTTQTGTTAGRGAGAGALGGALTGSAIGSQVGDGYGGWGALIGGGLGALGVV